MIKPRSILSLLLPILLLCGCTRPANPVNAGVLLLKSVVAVQMKENGLNVIDADWQHNNAEGGHLDNHRLPNWADTKYNSCVIWEEAVDYVITDNDTGRRRSGVGRCTGAILISKNLESQIVELLFFEEDGTVHTLINDWEEPKES